MASRRGAALLEVMTAVTIFGFAATGALSLLGQLAATEQQIRDRELVVADRDRLMTAYSLLSRSDLDLRLGTHAVGAHVVNVQRPTEALYRVTVGDSSGPELVTLLYRPLQAPAE
jgi:hypothetical protein